MADWDVVIVGAGRGGLAVGALLAKAGKKVLILEKESHVGGRGSSVSHKGRIIERPNAYIRDGNWEGIFARVGKPFPKVSPLTESLVYQDGEWVNAMDLFDRKQLRKIIGEIVACSYEELEEYDDVLLKDWVSARTNDEFIHLLFWAVAVGAYGGTKYETYSAGENLFFLKDMIDKFGSIAGMYGWYEGGFSQITQPLYAVIKEKGGEVRTSSRVLDIIIENGQACGVEVEVGEKLVPAQVADTEVINALIVVCTLPLWDLFKVLNPHDLPRWYVDWVEGIKNRIVLNPVVTLGLDKPVGVFSETTGGFVTPEYTKSGIAMTPSPVPGYGAAGEHVLSTWWLASYEEVPPNILDAGKTQNWRQMKKLFDSFDKDLRNTFPGVEKHILWEERYIIPFGLACMPDLVGKRCPAMQPPGVDNLYLVSDTVREARGASPGCVARAATICADRILSKQ